jgi:hypothetical protein
MRISENRSISDILNTPISEKLQLKIKNMDLKKEIKYVQNYINYLLVSPVLFRFPS